MKNTLPLLYAKLIFALFVIMFGLIHAALPQSLVGTRGIQSEVIYSSPYANGQSLGYLEYLPAGYEQTDATFPVIISLHGIDQRGSGDQIEFDKLRTGAQLAKRIERGEDYPFIIITPQQPRVVKDRYTSIFRWDPYIVDEVLERVKMLRRVDLDRIYICGESMGGGGVWKYLSLFGDKIAAAVPVAGTNTTGVQVACDDKIKNTPVWAFHNDGDAIVPATNTVKMVHAINACEPPLEARQTIFSSSSHNAWDAVYSFPERKLSALYESTPYGPFSRSQDIFSWLLSQRLDREAANQPPVAKAGKDQQVKAMAAIKLDGRQSFDQDGTIVSYRWKQVGGTKISMSNTARSTVALTLPEGTYQFELAVTDDLGAVAVDTTQIAVLAEEAAHGLHYAYYEGSWTSLPDFRYVTPLKTGTISDINLNARLSDDYFGFVFTGKINIQAAGNHTFYLNSDDGSRLYIDEQLAVDNDGAHASREVKRSVSLTPGMHDIRLEYFERGGNHTLNLSYSGPGFAKRLVPAAVLYLGEEQEPRSISNAGGLSYTYYEGEWEFLPDFDKLKPLTEGFAADFSMKERKSDDNYAFRYRGYLSVEQQGTYTFYTTSDDGSRLYIDQKLVVDNDGRHGSRERQGTLSLQPGMHIIEVVFFEHSGNQILEVDYTGPGFGKKPVLAEKLFTNIEKPTLNCLDTLVAPPVNLVNVYPSNLQQELTVTCDKTESTEFLVTLYNQYGEVYFTRTVLLSAEQPFHLNVSSLNIKPGMVYLRAESKEGLQIIKLIKP